MIHIQIKNLRCDFNGQPILKGLNLDLAPGKVTTIVGRSGCGKSVLLKHILGLMKPDSGELLIDGQDISQLEEGALEEIRQRFGMLFQRAALLDSLTVFENVAFPLREKTELGQDAIRGRVERELNNVGIMGMKDKYPAELSGVMKKRAGLARALVMEPGMVLFDEPATGLDPHMKKVFHQLIFRIQRRAGFTALVVSHDIPGVFDISDHVAVMEDGALLEAGAPEAIQESVHPLVREFLQGRTPTAPGK